MKKQNIIGLVGGLGIILLFYIIIQVSLLIIFPLIEISNSVNREPQNIFEIKSFVSLHNFPIKVYLLQLFVYFGAGLFVGKHVKKTGWLYGGMLGILWIVVEAIIEQITNDKFMENTQQYIFSWLIIIGLTTLGGMLASKLRKA